MEPGSVSLLRGYPTPRGRRGWMCAGVKKDKVSSRLNSLRYAIRPQCPFVRRIAKSVTAETSVVDPKTFMHVNAIPRHVSDWNNNLCKRGRMSLGFAAAAWIPPTPPTVFVAADSRITFDDRIPSDAGIKTYELGGRTA